MNEKIMTIGIDASRANVYARTGTEWYAYHVIQELKKIIPSEYRVVLYSREPLRPDLADLPVNWKSVVLNWQPRYFWTQLRLSWEMWRRPPDLLYVPAHTLPLILPKKSVTTLHDTAFVTVPDAYSFKGRTYHKFAAWFAVRFATGILTVSDFSKREIVRLFGADKDSVSVTHLASDASFRADYEKEKVLEKIKKYELTQPYILFVGRLERKKNFSVALQAFEKIRQAEDCKLVLVGKRGRGADQVFERITELGLDKEVIELGYVSAEDLPYVYAGASVFLFPSRYEGFGIPLLEAFGSGVPVVASDCTSIPEVVDGAGILVPPDDYNGFAEAVLQVLRDKKTAEELISKGILRAQEFSWRKTAEGVWQGILRAL